MLTNRPGRYKSLCPRRMHHRNPSMTPTIGLSEYNNRYCSGTTLELNPTGDYRNNRRKRERSSKWCRTVRPASITMTLGISSTLASQHQTPSSIADTLEVDIVTRE